MYHREESPNYESPNRRSKLRPRLDEYKVLAKPRKSKNRQKRIRSFEEFSEKCQGPFWINSNYRNITPAHVCCGRIHKSLDSKSAKNEMVKIEEADEDVATLGKKFEASKDMKKVEQAKTQDGQDNDRAVVKTDLKRSQKSPFIIRQTFSGLGSKRRS